MEVLHCTANYGQIYYVEYKGRLHECRLVRTESREKSAAYVLDVADEGEVIFQFNRHKHFDAWYNSSKAPSILYESIEDFRRGKPITDEYGSTGNVYNADFMRPLFLYHLPCTCGGDMKTWSWDGVRPVEYNVNTSRVFWSWDERGFHCSLNDPWHSEEYRSAKECEAANSIQIVRFEK